MKALYHSPFSESSFVLLYSSIDLDQVTKKLGIRETLRLDWQQQYKGGQCTAIKCQSICVIRVIILPFALLGLLPFSLSLFTHPFLPQHACTPHWQLYNSHTPHISTVCDVLYAHVKGIIDMCYHRSAFLWWIRYWVSAKVKREKGGMRQGHEFTSLYPFIW